MLALRTSKNHLEFDYAAAAKLYTAEKGDAKLSGELITSPWDLYAVESLRDRHGLRMGEEVPTDVFVFGFGEPEDPSWTKVGGRPYWPADKEWPALEDGSPAYFLAQFNFADSRDLFDFELPGEVLVITTNSEEEWIWEEEGLSFHWLPSGITATEELPAPLPYPEAGPFYGVIHRTADYPDSLKSSRKLDVSQAYNLAELNGTKIGGVPNFIQGGPETTPRFLCALGSIQAEPNVPYPSTNRREPLSLEFKGDGIYADQNCAVIGDMGNIYLFIAPDGTVSTLSQCY